MTLGPGTTLGSYVIDALIGEGAMGAVYRARDVKLQRTVAIKFLAEPPASGGDRQVLREARAASALSHPHICTIFEVAESGDGQSFIVMEFVDGRTLDALIPPGGLPPATVVQFGVQVADALAHAHERRVIHRDLKAANILVSPEGRTKVLDFGLAERLTDETMADATRSASMDTVVAGTLSHMAPELLRGAPGDARSDVWALGVVLSQMASGRVPFQRGSSYELVTAIVEDPPAPLPPSVPAGVRAVVARCLEKDPEQRYQRAGEVRAALELVGDLSRATPAPAGIGATASGSIVRRAGYAAAVMLAVVAFAGLWWTRTRPRHAPSGGVRITSIAVLPLTNFSRDSQQEYFSDGLTEALIASIAQIRGLRVTSRTSVMRYKETTKSIPEIGRDLGVDALLEGSVMRSGDRVRITAQLIRAGTDEHLWAETYDRDLKDVLTLQSEVARAVARQVQMNLTPLDEARLARARPVNPEAHEAYLKGRFYWNQRSSDAVARAIEFFQKAVAADPEYAPPYAGLAGAYLSLTNWDLASRPPRELIPKAEAAAMKAIQIDESLAEAHVPLASARLGYDWDWPAAEREFTRAIELDPNYPLAHFWYGTCLAAAGRFDAAIAEAKRSQALDPVSPIYTAAVAWMYHFARRDEGVIEYAKKSLELDPEFAIGLGRLGVAYRHLGRLPEATAVLEHAVAVSRSSSSVSQLALTYAAAGRGADARAQLEVLLKMSREGAAVAFPVAMVYGGLADKDQAFTWLERAFEERSGMMAYLAIDPDLDPLRSDPRFAGLVRRVGLLH